MAASISTSEPTTPRTASWRELAQVQADRDRDGRGEQHRRPVTYRVRDEEVERAELVGDGVPGLDARGSRARSLWIAGQAAVEDMQTISAMTNERRASAADAADRSAAVAEAVAQRAPRLEACPAAAGDRGDFHAREDLQAARRRGGPFTSSTRDVHMLCTPAFPAVARLDRCRQRSSSASTGYLRRASKSTAPSRLPRAARSSSSSRPERLVRAVARARRRQPRHLQERDHGDDRPLGLRQEHVHPLPEPDERSRAGRQGRRQGPLPRSRPLRLRRGPGRGPPADRDGVPAAEPVPEVDLRQRRLRAKATSACRTTWTSASSGRCAGPRCGTR